MKMDEGEKLKVAEKIADAVFLVEAAQKCGVIIQQIADDPLNAYMAKRPKRADVGVMAEGECPFCTSIIEDVDVSYLLY